MQPYGLLEACRYEELNKHTPIFNIYALDGDVWVHLPSWVRGYALANILDISGQFPVDVLFTPATVMQDYPRPWLQISMSILDFTSGQHIYKLTFETVPPSCDTQSVFISYIARDNNPTTPYIYMPNRGNPDKIDTTEYTYEEEHVTDD